MKNKMIRSLLLALSLLIQSATATARDPLPYDKTMSPGLRIDLLNAIVLYNEALKSDLEVARATNNFSQELLGKTMKYASKSALVIVDLSVGTTLGAIGLREFSYGIASLRQGVIDAGMIPYSDVLTLIRGGTRVSIILRENGRLLISSLRSVLGGAVRTPIGALGIAAAVLAGENLMATTNVVMTQEELNHLIAETTRTIAEGNSEIAALKAK